MYNIEILKYLSFNFYFFLFPTLTTLLRLKQYNLTLFFSPQISLTDNTCYFLAPSMLSWKTKTVFLNEKLRAAKLSDALTRTKPVKDVNT